MGLGFVGTKRRCCWGEGGSVSPRLRAGAPTKSSSGRKRLNTNTLAGLPRDWAGVNKLFMCFCWKEEKRTHTQIAPPSRTIPRIFSLCYLLFGGCYRSPHDVAPNLMTCTYLPHFKCLPNMSNFLTATQFLLGGPMEGRIGVDNEVADRNCCELRENTPRVKSR